MSQTSKSTMRTHAKSVLAQMNADDRDKRSAFVCAQIEGMTELIAARTVLMYASIPGEVDLDPLMRLLIGRGVQVCVPRIDWDAGTMLPAVIGDVDTDLVVGRYSLRSPGGNCDEIPVSGLELVLVPGLAFDRSGGRLGRGAGFYDRLLAGGVQCPVIGVCFARQIVEQVPMEAHDRVMDRIVCEEGVMRREHR